MAKLGEVCKVSASTKMIDKSKAWLLNLDMVEQQTGRVVEYNFVGEDGLNGSITQFDTENVLYSKLRPNLNKVVLPERDGFCTSELLPLRPDARKLDRSYLAVFLRSDGFVNWAVSKTAGAKMPRLGTKDLLNANIPLPEIKEQKAIAEKFKKSEELISLRKQQLAKLDELVKARFVEMFGGYVPNAKLSDVASITGGLTKNSNRNKMKLKLPYLRVANVSYAKIDVSEMLEIGLTEDEKAKTLLSYDDLLFVEGNGSPDQIGRVALWRNEITPCVHQNHLIKARFISHLIVPCFALYYFMSQEGRKQIRSKAVSTSGLYTLSVSKISNLLIPTPPLSLQNQFATFVERVDQQKQTVQQSLEKLELMKKALMQEYFG